MSAFQLYQFEADDCSSVATASSSRHNLAPLDARDWSLVYGTAPAQAQAQEGGGQQGMAEGSRGYAVHQLAGGGSRTLLSCLSSRDPLTPAAAASSRRCHHRRQVRACTWYLLPLGQPPPPPLTSMRVFTW